MMAPLRPAQIEKTVSSNILEQNPHLPLRSEPDWPYFLSLRERTEVRVK
jgi:hypothetical protein